ncbi:hypothetical protein GOODEAATRI_017241 [Goodea atripinnis]|uniref:BRCT domain-containing protein n=1 Tax=Goodea atripinnis TaxID=208336 RepID=A0ABV0PYR4_9TELE
MVYHLHNWKFLTGRSTGCDCWFLSQICRLQRHLSAGEHQQDLFQDQPAMFVSQRSQPPAQSLVELIELCGGTACKTVRQAGICIGKYTGRRPEGSRILSEQWVLGKMDPSVCDET